MLFLSNPAQSISITVKLATLNSFQQTKFLQQTKDLQQFICWVGAVVTIIADRLRCLSSSTAACFAGP